MFQILSSLVMDTGMSLCLVWTRRVPGILVGVAGTVGMIAAYPVYVRTTEREKKRVAPEILRLTEELLQ